MIFRILPLYFPFKSNSDFPRKVQLIGGSRFTSSVEITELIRKEKHKCTRFLRRKAVLRTIHTTVLFFSKADLYSQIN